MFSSYVRSVKRNVAAGTALKAFLKSNGTGCKVLEKFCCTFCNHWHARTVAPDPVGGSSGTGRSSKSQISNL
jgi:hypothetical protein